MHFEVVVDCCLGLHKNHFISYRITPIWKWLFSGLNAEVHHEVSAHLVMVMSPNYRRACFLAQLLAISCASGVWFQYFVIRFGFGLVSEEPRFSVRFRQTKPRCRYGFGFVICFLLFSALSVPPTHFNDD